jgi:CRISPR-associated protein Cas2
MTVVTLSSCPPSLRGDLTLWLQEINTGTFVGNVNARVRDLLWERIQKTIRSGRATMVYSAKNEQGMEFRIHNGTWTVVNYDGIKMVKRPLGVKTNPADGKAIQKDQEVPKVNVILEKAIYPKTFVVIDLETTGLKPENSQIIEIGAIRVVNGDVLDNMECFVHAAEIPEYIEKMTGITSDMLKNGLDEKEAMQKLKEFIGNFPVVAHNVKFDLDFIRTACERSGIEWNDPLNFDTVKIAREKIPGMQSYKLENLLEHFQLSHEHLHRALNDSRAVYALYCKLNEK